MLDPAVLVLDMVWSASRRRAMERQPSTVYNAGGCSSYYLDGNGRNSFSRPWSTGHMRRRLARFDAEAYAVTTR